MRCHKSLRIRLLTRAARIRAATVLALWRARERSRSNTLPCFVGFCVLLAQGAPAQEKQSRLPDGQGRAAVQKICAGCHEIETVISSRRTKIGWEQTTEDMIARGAEGSDEEMDAIVEYLATYFGKVNVNTATVEQLVKSLDLSAKEAQAISIYRERNGKIKDFEELSKVPGVSAEKLQAKRGLIAFRL